MGWFSSEIIDNRSQEIGEIKAFMRTTAPRGYLACDGASYNIGAYPLLEELITTEFGAVNYFGGDGTTSWNVPDLRGEFLRGTGTNSHTNQGSGANVGVHQDSSEIGNLQVTGSNTATYGTAPSSNIVRNYDNQYNVWGFSASNTLTVVSANIPHSTLRPTNTSVLYCIRAY